MKPPQRNQIICGNNLDVIKPWPSNCIDAICTDPPYGLEFMGKDWDKGLPGIRFWREFLRIAKPGGFLLCFGGTRTYHRLTCAIEDAGWEIRDCMMYLYGSGFPKGHNYAYQIHKKAESEAKHDLRFVRKTYLSTAIYACRECGQILLTCLSEQGAPEFWKTWAKSKIAAGKKSCVEGWSHLETPERELQRCPICTMSHQIFADGSEGRIHNRTSTRDGKTLGQTIETNRSGSSSRPQSKQQSNQEPYAVSLERLAQAHRGNSTALKPAWEPIIVAMKPIDGTFAQNAEKYGVAGLNIDGGRIGTEKRFNQKASNPTDRDTAAFHAIPNPHNYQGKEVQGRWPANLILECICDEVVETDKTVGRESGYDFELGNQNNPARNVTNIKSGVHYKDKVRVHTNPDCPCTMLDEQSGVSSYPPRIHNKVAHGKGPTYFQEKAHSKEYADKGGASRFFYCAKCSKKERNLGLEKSSGKKVNDGRETPIDNPYQRGETIRQNTHPTVKPLALMKYLCTLLKMPSAEQVILDPFLGSGTTGMACLELGIDFIGIEKEREYCEIAVKRIATVEGIHPVILHTETPPAEVPKAIPCHDEHRQRIINAACAALRRNRK